MLSRLVSKVGSFLLYFNFYKTLPYFLLQYRKQYWLCIEANMLYIFIFLTSCKYFVGSNFDPIPCDILRFSLINQFITFLCENRDLKLLAVFCVKLNLNYRHTKCDFMIISFFYLIGSAETILESSGVFEQITISCLFKTSGLMFQNKCIEIN